MKITINNYMKTPVDLDVLATNTIIDIVEMLKIVDSYNTVPVYRHLLFFNDLQLDHDKTLDYYNIVDGSLLVWKLLIGHKICQHCLKI
jgi:hypothetical protein